MKVKDLIKELKKLNQDAIVVLQKDGEGNSYSPLSGVEEAFYVAESTWGGEVYDEEDEDLELPDDAEPCAVIWPVN